MGGGGGGGGGGGDGGFREKLKGCENKGAG